MPAARHRLQVDFSVVLYSQDQKSCTLSKSSAAIFMTMPLALNRSNEIQLPARVGLFALHGSFSKVPSKLANEPAPGGSFVESAW